MISINTNLASLMIQSNLKASTKGLNTAIERLTTGCKINHAKDNAANYAISVNIDSQISSYEVALENTSMGLDLITTATDNLDLITSHLQRMRDLAEQAANGTYGEDSLKAMQKEIDARNDEINRIMSNTEYNGIKLFEGDSQGVTGSFISEVTQLTEEEALAQGYTVIKTADELQAMQYNLSGKYILMNDIDLSGYDWTPVGSAWSSSSKPFEGELNGNGYVIKNLTINNPNEDYQGLFGVVNSATIKNVGLKNVDVTGGYNVGGLVGYLMGTITNCYVTGSVSGNDSVGGIAGWITGHVSNSSFKGSVSGNYSVGGFVGSAGGAIISNSSASGSVSGNDSVGGFAGWLDTGEYTNCSASVSVSGLENYGDFFGNNSFNNVTTVNCSSKSNNIDLQVGIHSGENSVISIKKGFDLSVSVDVTTSQSARSALDTLDAALSKVSTKQTEYGAAYNRLESAAESIGVNIENLTSTLSTIRDADIAEVSSEYIRNQILQQAAATLLATANQTPSIALQLL